MAVMMPLQMTIRGQLGCAYLPQKRPKVKLLREGAGDQIGWYAQIWKLKVVFVRKPESLTIR